jgi:hypothetical protein
MRPLGARPQLPCRSLSLNAASVVRHIVRRKKTSCRLAPTVCVGTRCTARSCLALQFRTPPWQHRVRPWTQDHWRLANANRPGAEELTISPRSAHNPTEGPTFGTQSLPRRLNALYALSAPSTRRSLNASANQCGAAASANGRTGAPSIGPEELPRTRSRRAAGRRPTGHRYHLLGGRRSRTACADRCGTRLLSVTH